MSEFLPSDWIALYGAGLSTMIAVVASWRFIAHKLREKCELRKFQTDLYFLRKIDRTSQKVHPIVVVLLANLGSSRVSIKSLEYEGIAENGVETRGVMGWYEQPEAAYGIRNRLLPCVLESGQTADLPMVEIGVITRIHELKIWLTDFSGRKFYVEDRDIDKARRDIERYLSEDKPTND